MPYRKIFLNLFGEGAGGAAGAAAPAGDGGTAGTAPSGTGEKTKVLYGKQDVAEPEATPAAEEPSTKSPEDRRKAFLDMVKGEYKDIYTQETQKIIDRRFRETKDLEESQKKSKPVLDMLMQRYGIEDGDVSKLQEAVENDDVYWSEAADEAGMTVDQYKRFQKMQRQNAELLKAQEEQQARASTEAQVQQWMADAQEVKGIYPDFDLQAEISNPRFAGLLQAGIPVKLAYEVIHLSSIVGDAKASAAAQAERAVTDNIRARGMRPKENGTQSQAAFTVKDDVSKLTRAERADIAQRVAMGERIRF